MENSAEDKRSLNQKCIDDYDKRKLDGYILTSMDQAVYDAARKSISNQASSGIIDEGSRSEAGNNGRW